jgi:DNA-directed RNA polymerase subunit RPC12/RpoP
MIERFRPSSMWVMARASAWALTDPARLRQPFDCCVAWEHSRVCLEISPVRGYVTCSRAKQNPRRRDGNVPGASRPKQLYTQTATTACTRCTSQRVIMKMRGNTNESGRKRVIIIRKQVKCEWKQRGTIPRENMFSREAERRGFLVRGR